MREDFKLGHYLVAHLARPAFGGSLLCLFVRCASLIRGLLTDTPRLETLIRTGRISLRSEYRRPICHTGEIRRKPLQSLWLFRLMRLEPLPRSLLFAGQVGWREV